MEISKFRKPVALAIAFALAIGCVCAGRVACSEPVKAVSTAIKCEVYNPSPRNMTISAGDTEKIKKASKYVFKVKNLKTFSSLESIIKALDGKTCRPGSFDWVSSNEKIVTTSGSKITGVKKGTAYVYPVPKSVCSYKTKGRYVIYTDINLLSGIKISGGFAIKVKVTK